MTENDAVALAEQVAAVAGSAGLTVAVAESLTAGQISAALGAAPEAADWYRGGVVAYAPEVKFDVLGVTPGPVNTASCALEMARGVLRVVGADVAVAVTGVGGPGPDEGVPEGTVFVATGATGGPFGCRELHLDGSPGEVVAGTVQEALRVLIAMLRSAADDRSRHPST